MNIEKVVREAEVLAEECGWRVIEKRVASTGSVYIDVVREYDGEREWCVIRVANHKKVYERWMVTHSLAPNDLWIHELEEVLRRPFGDTGDIL